MYIYISIYILVYILVRAACAPRILRLESQDGATPLAVATQNGHTVVMDRLIAAGADVESKAQVPHAHNRERKRAHAYTCAPINTDTTRARLPPQHLFEGPGAAPPHARRRGPQLARARIPPAPLFPADSPARLAASTASGGPGASAGVRGAVPAAGRCSATRTRLPI